MVCSHKFDVEQKESGPPEAITFEELDMEVMKSDCEVIAHSYLVNRIASLSPNVIDASETLASLIAKRIYHTQLIYPLNPVYAIAR